MTTPNRREIRERPIRTAADLHLMWQTLMGDGGFGRRTLWIGFLDSENLPIPTLVPIDDLPLRPDAEFIDGLRPVLAELASDGAMDTATMLLSRPGAATMTADDRAWAQALAPLSAWPIHLATADHVQVFAPDDLLTD